MLNSILLHVSITSGFVCVISILTLMLACAFKCIDGTIHNIIKVLIVSFVVPVFIGTGYLASMLFSII